MIMVLLFQSSWLKKWKLTGAVKSIKKNKNCPQLIAAYKVGKITVICGFLAICP